MKDSLAAYDSISIFRKWITEFQTSNIFLMKIRNSLNIFYKFSVNEKSLKVFHQDCHSGISSQTDCHWKRLANRSQDIFLHRS